MSQSDVEAILNVLMTDNDLMLELWAVVEKAGEQANVASMTSDDMSLLLQGLAAQTTIVKPRFAYNNDIERS